MKTLLGHILHGMLGTVAELYLQIKTEIPLAKINLKHLQKMMISLISFLSPNHSASQKSTSCFKKAKS